MGYWPEGLPPREEWSKDADFLDQARAAIGAAVDELGERRAFLEALLVEVEAPGEPAAPVAEVPAPEPEERPAPVKKRAARTRKAN